MTASNILEHAGWGPIPGWSGYAQGTSVGGIAPSGTVYVKNWAMIPTGHPLHSIDTPDNAEEAAAWLVEHDKRRFSPPREIEPEPEAIGGDDEPDEAQPDRVEAGMGEDAPTAEDDETTIAMARVASEIDAEFAELEGGINAPQIGGPQLDGVGVVEGDAVAPPLLSEDIKDFAPDEVKRVREGVAIFGDNLPMQRMLLIGRIAEIALERCEAARGDWSDDEFRDLQSYVVSNLDAAGGFVGDADRYDKFVRLSDIQSTVRRIEAEQVKRVTFIRAASREEVATYDPEDGWP